jgi:hypothetical protein
MNRILEAIVTGWRLRLIGSAPGPCRVHMSDEGTDAGELAWLYRSEAFAEDLV